MYWQLSMLLYVLAFCEGSVIQLFTESTSNLQKGAEDLHKKLQDDTFENHKSNSNSITANVMQQINSEFPIIRHALAMFMGYKQAEGWLGFYNVHVDGQNWSNAQKVCAMEGADLVVFNSQEEADAIIKLLRGMYFDGFWVGFRKNADGNYVTIHNDTLESAGFYKWATKEPDQNDGEKCGMFDYTNGEIALEDRLCNNTFSFICEEKIGNTQTNLET